MNILKKRSSLSILVVGQTPPPYHGCSVMAEFFLQSSLSREFSIIFLDIADRRGIKNIGKFDIPNVYFALFHGLKFLYFLMRYNPNLLYLSISQNNLGYTRDLLFLLPARFVNKKMVVHLHGGAFHDFYTAMHWPLKKLTEFVFNGRVWGIVLGESLRFCFSGLIEPDKISIVPNGIDAFNPGGITDNHPKNFLHILYLANLSESKGFLDLLTIIPQITKRYPYTRFTFAGEQSNSEGIKKTRNIILKYQIQEFVNMPGAVHGHEKEQLLGNADIFVFPPRVQEGQPLVILEAMSAGLPIITTDRGAIRETVKDGITGFVIRPGDIEDLLKKLTLLIEDEKLRKRMGGEGRKYFEKEFTLERWVSNMKLIFRRVLECS